MKVFKKAGYLLLLGLIVAAAWFIPNYVDTMRMPPDSAAVEVAKRFETSPAGDYSARLARSFADSGRELSVFVVIRDGRDHARVTLSPFLGLGWQERSYERID